MPPLSDRARITINVAAAADRGLLNAEINVCRSWVATSRDPVSDAARQLLAQGLHPECEVVVDAGDDEVCVSTISRVARGDRPYGFVRRSSQ
jgi:hypothetical protein